MQQSVRVDGDGRDVKQRAELFQHLDGARLKRFHSVCARTFVRFLERVGRSTRDYSPDSSYQLPLHVQKRYHKAFVQLRRIHDLQLFVVAAVNVASRHFRIERGRSMYPATVLGMNPRLFAQVAVEAMLFLFQSKPILLVALSLAELVLEELDFEMIS